VYHSLMRNDLYGIMKPDEVRERLKDQKEQRLENWAHNTLVRSLGDLRHVIEDSTYDNLPKSWEIGMNFSMEEFTALRSKLRFYEWDETMYSTFHPENPDEPKYGIVLNLEAL